jgi:hypothetical protein
MLVTDDLLRWMDFRGNTPAERFNLLWGFLRASRVALSCFNGCTTRIPYRVVTDPQSPVGVVVSLTGPHFLDLLIVQRGFCPSPFFRSFLRALGMGFISYYQYRCEFERFSLAAATTVARTLSPQALTQQSNRNPQDPITIPVKKFHQIGLFRVCASYAPMNAAFTACRDSLMNRFGLRWFDPASWIHCFVLYFVCCPRTQFNRCFRRLKILNEETNRNEIAFVPHPEYHRCSPDLRYTFIYKMSYVPYEWSKANALRLATMFVRYLFAQQLPQPIVSFLDCFDFHADHNYLFVLPKRWPISFADPFCVQRMQEICKDRLYSMVCESVRASNKAKKSN